MKLSKREKVLLYMLAVVAILAGMILLVIQPVINRGNTLDTAILEQQMQNDEMQRLISQQAVFEKSIEENHANIITEEGRYLPLMNNDDLDKYITGMLQKEGLVAAALEISASEEPVPSEAVFAYNVAVSARGGAAQFVSLAERVGNTDGIRIASCSLVGAAVPTATPVPKATATPKPKKTPKRRKTTPTPEITVTPEPTPTPRPYAMEIRFVVMECDESLLSELSITPTPEQ